MKSFLDKNWEIHWWNRSFYLSSLSKNVLCFWKKNLKSRTIVNGFLFLAFWFNSFWSSRNKRQWPHKDKILRIWFSHFFKFFILAIERHWSMLIYHDFTETYFLERNWGQSSGLFGICFFQLFARFVLSFTFCLGLLFLLA